MAKVLYKPFGLLFSVLGGIVAGSIFKRIWGAAGNEEEAPKATDATKGWGGADGPRTTYCSDCWHESIGEEGRK